MICELNGLKKKINFKYVKDILGGSVIIIDTEGNVYEKQLIKKHEKPCMFEFVYFSKPDSCINGQSVHHVRAVLGRLIAKNHPVEADIVVPVPESGRHYATGYSRESGIPIDEGIIKDKAERSFIQQTQESRDKVVEEGLSYIRSVLDGKRVVLIEDSIVRGTQLKNFTITKLWEGGAKEVHVRVACPPLMFPCRFNFSTRTTHELAARKAIHSLEGHDPEDVSDYVDNMSDKYQKMVDWVTKDLGVTTLRYQKLDDMVKAIGMPRDQLCLYCWTGQYLKPKG